jgi:hypothetical protein
MNRNFGHLAFAVGLGVVAWVGYGYWGSNTLALTMTLLIATCYLAGAAELHRFRQATDGLRAALLALPAELTELDPWIATLPPSLGNAVRMRIVGERGGLPGPAITPYLVGLLVLLGMLGTFLGMVVTLNGAVMALESTTDLATIRAALSAPIKGLGLAFGTSIAGVAASAMLGLVSVWYRRERQSVAQLLDHCVATSLRVFSRAHQREQTLESLQQQARIMPAMVERLQDMMAQMQQHHESLGERLLAGQDRFHQHAQGAYTELASSVDRSLKDSLTESARLAGSAIAPAVQTAMQGITRETAQFQEKLASTVAQQLDGLSSRFDNTVGTVAGVWNGALARHESSSEALSQGLQQSLAGFNETFGQHTSTLLVALDERHAASAQAQQAAMAQLAQQSAGVHERMAAVTQGQLDGVVQRLDASTQSLADRWGQALAQQQRSSEALSEGLKTSVTELVNGFTQRSSALLTTVQQTHVALQADLASGDQQRLAAWSTSLQAMAQSLHGDAQRAAEQALAQQAQICQTLEQTAHAMQEKAQAQASDTIAEMSRLIETASEAPRAAAQVVDALREKLSDSMARDNTMLEERSRIMQTLHALLEAVNQAATEQRSAIDALVASSTAMLKQAGTQFVDKMEQEAARMGSAVTQVAGSAVEMAGMGEAFGVAVLQFGQASEGLTDHLQRIEVSLDKSTARSDEQLAYYVAQAREIVDLSISSQRQIVEDLQRLAIRQPALTGESA